jgi:hypothetical protein
VRVLALALALVALAAAPGAGGAAAPYERLAFLRGGDLVVLDLQTGRQQVVLRHAPARAIAWSGDGALLSDGGRVVGGPVLPATTLAWAPRGETAAFVTAGRGVDLWTPTKGVQTFAPAGWDATTVAWGADGSLVIGRYCRRRPCGTPSREGVWMWSPGGRLRQVVSLLEPWQYAIVDGTDAQGRPLWWDDPQGSGSIAADGITLFDGAKPLAPTLVFPDFVTVCGDRLAYAAGHDRYTTAGKRIVLDGRNVSGDPSLSWVSPSCGSSGLLAAAAGRSWQERYIGRGENRSIWELAPVRRRLTEPPPGWTDENPHVLPDGSILFVRTRETAVKQPQNWLVTDHGRIELIRDGRVTWIATTSWSAEELGGGGEYANYYGHYGWPWLVAVTP